MTAINAVTFGRHTHRRLLVSDDHMPDVTTEQYSSANRNTCMPEGTDNDMPQEFDSRRVDNKSYGHQRKIADQHQKTRSANSESAPPPEEILDDERKSWKLESPRTGAEYRR
jgi:hypothetical protein